EAMTDPHQDTSGVTITNELGDVLQIADEVAEVFSSKVNGIWLQSYLSEQDQAYVIPNGQRQDFRVGEGRLTVSGDQLGGGFNDVATITETWRDSVEVTLNGETVEFDRIDVNSVEANLGGG